MVGVVVAIITQLGLIAVFTIAVVKTVARNRLIGYRKFDGIMLCELAISLMAFICLRLNEEMGFIPVGAGYSEYEILIYIGLAAYWLKKTVPADLTFAYAFLSVISATLIFTSIYACVHLIHEFPLAIFPGFGLLILAPFWILAMAISDLLFSFKPNQSIRAEAIFSGTTMLLVFILIISNLWTDHPWDLLNYVLQPITNELPT